MDASARVVLLVAVLVVASGLLVGQALSYPGQPVEPEGDAYPGHTLITFQAEGWFGYDNGYAMIVAPNGSVVWRWKEPDSRVFDGEHLENGNVMLSVAEVVGAGDCPDEYAGRDACVRNRVVEVDFETKEVVWEYDWWDVFAEYHEVHDADRLPNGETVVADMGNHRAFAVARDGTVAWEWRAEDHISGGTAFWEEHVPADQEDRIRRQHPEGDWTHMNDVDLLENGNVLLSIRNYDVVLEVDRSGEIVEVYGTPGDHDVMQQQHNPNMLERHRTMLIADSENDRVVEIDAETEEIVWQYDTLPPDSTYTPRQLQWPRDADRLPNGNTLITDTRRFRVVEVDPNGTVVWAFDTRKQLGSRGIVYEADRIHLSGEHLPEEPDDVPSGRNLRSSTSGPITGAIATLDSWAGFVLPAWMGIAGAMLALVDLVALIALAREYRSGRL